MTQHRPLHDDDGLPPMEPDDLVARDFEGWWDYPSPTNYARRAAWCIRFGTKEHQLQEWNHEGRVCRDIELLTTLFHVAYLDISPRQLEWLERIERRIRGWCRNRYGPPPRRSPPGVFE